MIDTWLTALEMSGFATGLRNSVWAYPLVNTGHILGIALLVGAVVPLDLRLLGLWRTIPLGHLWPVLTPVAATGLALAVLCGLPLFATRATEYAALPLFWAKMILVLAGLLNVLLIRLALPGRNATFWLSQEPAPPRVRLAAAVSMLVWILALTLGRLIGYF